MDRYDVTMRTNPLPHAELPGNPSRLCVFAPLRFGFLVALDVCSKSVEPRRPHEALLRKSELPRVELDLDALRSAGVREEEKREQPCQVVLHNDDVTPMDYVPLLLRRVFRIGRARAFWLTLRAHVQGRVVVVIEPRAQAEAHVSDAHEMARRDGHAQLTLTLEPLES
jgi:ATP-dependent Clp protease adaptor protein ClpS